MRSDVSSFETRERHTHTSPLCMCVDYEELKTEKPK